mmetsp:Transcript_38109/g.82028  ORF Transcript_38109/g.82028 Transcript_38109/m.82028 type:complete len:275 (+) Transcript_38109:778-1602(+)
MKVLRRARARMGRMGKGRTARARTVKMARMEREAGHGMEKTITGRRRKEVRMEKERTATTTGKTRRAKRMAGKENPRTPKMATERGRVRKRLTAVTTRSWKAVPRSQRKRLFPTAGRMKKVKRKKRSYRIGELQPGLCRIKHLQTLDLRRRPPKLQKQQQWPKLELRYSLPPSLHQCRLSLDNHPPGHPCKRPPNLQPHLQPQRPPHQLHQPHQPQLPQPRLHQLPQGRSSQRSHQHNHLCSLLKGRSNHRHNHPSSHPCSHLCSLQCSHHIRH